MKVQLVIGIYLIALDDKMIQDSPFGLPSSHLLLAVQGKFPQIDLDIHMNVLDLMQATKMVTVKFHAVKLTDKGVELAKKINGLMASEAASKLTASNAPVQTQPATSTSEDKPNV